MIYSRDFALELLSLNEAGYALALAGSCDLPAGYAPAEPILMEVSKRPAILRFDVMQVWGYLTFRKLTGQVIVDLRGTQDLAEWAEDAIALPMVDHFGHSVHRGFHEVYSAIQANLRTILEGRTGNVLFTGHSLGAALATLAWMEFGGELFTFAGPRVTDPAGAQALWNGQTIRVINAPDIVPDVPTDPPFRHGGYEVRVDGPGSYFDRKLAHSVASYRIGINARA
ncbi:MAG: lipase family protein [Acidobacteriota bacterium]